MRKLHLFKSFRMRTSQHRVHSPTNPDCKASSPPKCRSFINSKRRTIKSGAASGAPRQRCAFDHARRNNELLPRARACVYRARAVSLLRVWLLKRVQGDEAEEEEEASACRPQSKSAPNELSAASEDAISLLLLRGGRRGRFRYRCCVV